MSFDEWDQNSNMSFLRNEISKKNKTWYYFYPLPVPRSTTGSLFCIKSSSTILSKNLTIRIIASSPNQTSPSSPFSWKFWFSLKQLFKSINFCEGKYYAGVLQDITNCWFLSGTKLKIVQKTIWKATFDRHFPSALSCRVLRRRSFQRFRPF